MALGESHDDCNVSFPPRNEPYDFRANSLEPKYRTGLGRPLTSSYVDIEGTIVWTQEYLRYRVNQCEHEDAVARVFSQIEGRGIQAVCGCAPSGNVAFPPRDQPFNFRQRLEAKYRDELRRTATQTAVDIEGDIVWTLEYLRYRVSGCTHEDTVSKVMAQIDGRGVQPDCGGPRPTPTPTPTTTPTPPPPTGPTDCAYALTSAKNLSVAADGGSGEVTFTQTAGSSACQWTASSDNWITLQDRSGTGSIRARYSVSQNTGAARNGTMAFRWNGPQVGENIGVSQAGASQYRIVVGITATSTLSQHGMRLYGGGTVTGPSGLNCTREAGTFLQPPPQLGICDVAVNSPGTYTLTATAGSAQSSFGGWSGACSGTSSACTVNVTGVTQVGAQFRCRSTDPASGC